ncbi:hypothetical protein [Streptomyces sp. NPDC048669]|uniref:hypothetical protein n=1 Tax=Streptomyces sp. NPDC048669 TaxID=3155267 RepID=UPI003416944B
MTLKFLGIIPNTPTGESPTIWLHEETGDLLIQSHKATEEGARECQAIGSIPGHSTDVPDEVEQARLLGLLWVPEGGRSRFDELKRPAKAPTVSHLREHLAHLDRLEALGATTTWLQGVPPGKVEHSAQRRRPREVRSMR